MSYCKEEGKDKIIFVTKEDQDEPVLTKDVKDLEIEDDHEEGEGLILENGDINWNCPCLGGMASGPCGVEFRDAFSCFHYSEADPKGSDCIDNFRTMQECMVNYPELYPVGEDKEKAMLEETEGVSKDEVREEVHHISESLEIKQEEKSSSGIEKDGEESTVVSSEAKATENGSAASSSETDNDAVAKESAAPDIQECNS